MFMNTLKWKSSCWRPNHCWLEVRTLVVGLMKMKKES